MDENELKVKLIDTLIEKDKLNEAIDLALSAPFPQLAVHHLIDNIIEKLSNSFPKN